MKAKLLLAAIALAALGCTSSWEKRGSAQLETDMWTIYRFMDWEITEDSVPYSINRFIRRIREYSENDYNTLKSASGLIMKHVIQFARDEQRYLDLYYSRKPIPADWDSRSSKMQLEFRERYPSLKDFYKRVFYTPSEMDSVIAVWDEKIRAEEWDEEFIRKSLPEWTEQAEKRYGKLYGILFREKY